MEYSNISKTQAAYLKSKEGKATQKSLARQFARRSKMEAAMGKGAQKTVQSIVKNMVMVK